MGLVTMVNVLALTLNVPHRGIRQMGYLVLEGSLVYPIDSNTVKLLVNINKELRVSAKLTGPPGTP